MTVMGSIPASDPMYFNHYTEGSTSFINLQCTLGTAQQTFTGTLGTVVPQNKASNQLLTAPLPSGAARDQLIVNATHPSNAWVYTGAGGSSFNFSQPIHATISGNVVSAVAELAASWTTGDSVTGYSPSTIYLVQAMPFGGTTFPGGGGTSLRIQGCNIATVDYIEIDPWVQLIDSEYSSAYLLESAAINGLGTFGPNITPNIINVNGENGQLRGVASMSIYGGLVASISSAQGGIVMDGDVINQATDFYGPWVLLGNVYQVLISKLYAFTNVSGVIWGGAALAVNGGNELVYPSGAGMAAATFLNTGGVRLDAVTTACSLSSTSTITCGISLTPTNLDAAASATGFGGTAFHPGQSAITNVSPD
jgi:hypothetical protein